MDTEQVVVHKKALKAVHKQALEVAHKLVPQVPEQEQEQLACHAQLCVRAVPEKISDLSTQSMV